VHLDGGASSDDQTATPNLVFSWTLTAKPAGSAAALDDAGSATPSFLADLPGPYTAQLVVTDGDGLASPAAPVTVTANAVPTACAQASGPQVVLGGSVTFGAACSSDPESDPLTYQWTLSQKPPGSAASLAGATTTHATLVPDLPGDYEVTLTVSDRLGAGAPVRLTIIAAPGAVATIPTLSASGALALGALLILAALGTLRRTEGARAGDPRARRLPGSAVTLSTDSDRSRRC
jgi:hypothetical protein